MHLGDSLVTPELAKEQERSSKKTPAQAGVENFYKKKEEVCRNGRGLSD
jgi:hypothetical protein